MTADGRKKLLCVSCGTTYMPGERHACASADDYIPRSGLTGQNTETGAVVPRADETPKEYRDRVQQRDEPALRYDAGKPRYELIPADALAALAEVYTRGAAKYADRNWEKGMSWGRCFGSLMRHSWAFWRGEQNDSETGCHHMAMAAWNCFALVAYSLRAIGTDDRAKENEE